MRLGHPGSTTQTRIIFTMKITPLSTLMIAVPGKCIMISNPDVFQCVNLLSFSLGTKLSFHLNKKLVGKGFKRNFKPWVDIRGAKCNIQTLQSL